MERRSSTWVGFRALLCLMVATVAACGGGGGGDGPNNVPVIRAVALSPANSEVAKGVNDLQMSAVATLTDGSTQIITDDATWQSSNNTVASISAAGIVTAKAEGSTTITATVTGGITASTLLKVTPAIIESVAITPPAPEVKTGLKLQLTATATLSDGTPQDVTNTALWSSQNQAVATVVTTGAARGLLSGISAGTSRITVLVGGKFAVQDVTVKDAALSKIEIEPDLPAALPKNGFTQQFTATGFFDDDSTVDLTTQATWTSSVPASATISNEAGKKGLATSAAQKGDTNITATFGGKSDTVKLTVDDLTLTSLTVTPSAPSIGLGQTQQFSAMGRFTRPPVGSSTTPTTEDRDVTAMATWTSSIPATATIDGSGLASSQSTGEPTTITASLTTIEDTATLTVTDAVLTAIEVSPANDILPQGYTRTFSATGTFSDGSVKDVSNSVTWLSERSRIATISNASDSKGVARGGSEGDSDISAVQGSITGKTNLTVTSAALASIQVDPDIVSLPGATTQRFKAIGIFSDETQMDITEQAGLSFESSDTNVASISNVGANKGLATGKAEGETTIKATKSPLAAEAAVSGTASLTVTAATITELSIRVGGADCGSAAPVESAATLPNLFKRNFIACAAYSDGSRREVTADVAWSSGNDDVIVVSNESASKGRVTAKSESLVVLVAKLSGMEDSQQVRVTGDTLSSIAVTPSALTQTASGTRPTGDGEPVLANGESLQFFAVGTFSDGATLPITDQVVWSSDNSVVTISNAVGSEGKASAAGTPFAQQVTITAARDGVKDEFMVRRRAAAP